MCGRYEIAHQSDKLKFPKQLCYTEKTNILLNRLTTVITDPTYANYREAIVRVLGSQEVVKEDFLQEQNL